MAKQIHIPKLFTILKWTFLIVIAVATALVGFAQSMLVAALYKTRTDFLYNIVSLNEAWVPKFFQFTGFNLLLAFLSSLSLFLISPAAAGSGIPDVKAYLNGVESPIFRNFFTVKTFVAKVIGSSLAVASGLVMGKEGPMLHAGSILAVILGSSSWFKQKMDQAMHWGTYTYNRDIRDLVACGAACGVCTAFKAPVGGVLFAMEMSTRWRKELTWRCFLVSAITIVVVRYSVSTCVKGGHCTYLQWGSLIWFNQAYPTPYEQIWAFMLMAVIGGYIGSLFTSFNTWVCLVRKRWSGWFSFRVLEVCVLAVITSIIRFALPLAGRCHPCDTADPEHCVKGSAMFRTFQGYHCGEGTYNDLAVLTFNPQGFLIQALFVTPSGTFHISSLLIYSTFYWLLAALTYGCFIPSGLFTVSLIFGGCFGRIFAEVLVTLGWIDLSTPGIVGMYALIGAASFLGGLMRMSASMCLILMEMTGAPNTLPFLMLALVIAKGVGDRFNYSVFDHQIMLKGLNFIGGHPEHVIKRAHLEAEQVMSKIKDGSTFHIIETGSNLATTLDAHKTTNAFPVLSVPLSPEDPGDFMGIISRVSARELLTKAGEECDEIDLSSKVEIAPVVIPPSMPLQFIYSIMTEQGLNYLPVIRQHTLLGMITRQDIVTTQNQILDKFHLKQSMDQAAQDIEEGKILRSMHIEKQTAALRAAVLSPLLRAQELLKKDINEADEELDDPFSDRAPMIYLNEGGSSSAHASRPASRQPSRVASRQASMGGLASTREEARLAAVPAPYEKLAGPSEQ